ncbi:MULTISPECIES: AbrB/MazE/SpoVT family DNA-binding domain-containing protein [Evansella]|uniref:AbrB/MazE/SpoVT family DNA-binding domain-containing protein n=1 Tax=Evansella TaxID=2837485 RepID=UPI0009967405|nr:MULTISPECIES: AbrB/MazE/SpoVT family DNA-binding domain-containing protein [Evansella]
MQKAKYSISVQINKLIGLEIKCIVSRNFTMTLPKKIRQECGLSVGDLVNVGFSEEGRGLIISKPAALEDSVDNKVIIGQKNRIIIPAELRKNLQIKKGDSFTVYQMTCKNAFFLRKEDDYGN